MKDTIWKENQVLFQSNICFMEVGRIKEAIRKNKANNA